MSSLCINLFFLNVPFHTDQKLSVSAFMVEKSKKADFCQTAGVLASVA